MTTWLCFVVVSPAAERLRHILGDDDNVPTPTIFTEMDTLQQEGGELEWKESARSAQTHRRVSFNARMTGFQSKWNFFHFCRWVKFEEKVEEGGERWSKPHVSTLTLHSLFELRTCLQTGSILLDLEGYSLPQIVGENPLQISLLRFWTSQDIDSSRDKCSTRLWFQTTLWIGRLPTASFLRSWKRRSASFCWESTGIRPRSPSTAHWQIWGSLPVLLQVCFCAVFLHFQAPISSHLSNLTCWWCHDASLF